MVALALVLMVLALVATVIVLASNAGVYDLAVLGASVPVTSGGVFLAGAATMLVFAVGLALLVLGLRRARARRRRLKALRSAAAPQPATPATRQDDRPASRPSGTTAESDSTATATTTTERQSMLAEADALTRDDPAR